MFLFEAVYFILVVFFSFFVPGLLLIDFLKLSFSKIEKIFFSLAAGISIFLIITYLLSYLQLSRVYLLVLLVLNVYFFFKHHKKIKNLELSLDKKEVDIISLAIISLGVISFSYVMFFSGWKLPDGLRFLGINAADGIRHLSYIQNEISHFPPQHPGIVGLSLKGFHYFYDFLLARFIQFFGFNLENLYFRFFPPLLALLYGTAFYIFAKRLKVNLTSQRLILFFAFFSQSFSFVPYLLNKQISITYSATLHPLGLIVNPFTVLPMGMLFGSLAILPDIKKSYKYAIFLALVFGVLAQIKIYAGIIGIASISFYGLILLLFYKGKYLKEVITLLFLTAFLTAITYLPTNLGQGGLVWAPLLFYWEAMKNPIFNFLNWVVKYQISKEAGDSLKVVFLLLQAVVIYWIYNLGLLLIALLGLKNLLRKSFWLNHLNFILFIAISISILIPTLFIQSFNVFEIHQFIWFTISLFAIPAGIVIGNFAKTKFLKIAIWLLLILFSLPGILDTIFIYNPFKNNIVVLSSQVQFYKQIQRIVPKDKFIIYIPPSFKDRKGELYFYEFPGTTTLNSYFLNREIYLEGGGLPSKSSRSIEEKRVKVLITLDKKINDCEIDSIRSKLKDIGTPFILTSKTYSCFDKNNSVQKISTENLNFYYIK